MTAGRPAATPKVTGIEDITREDIAAFRPKTLPAMKQIRDSHHAMARLFAMGLRSGEVAEQVGYSLSRVSLLRNDPAFCQLVEEYRGVIKAEFGEAVDEYYSTVARNRNLAARMINDKLTDIEDPADISFRELIAIHADSADRTGYPKRTVAVNVNVDFAARLDRAIERSNKARLVSSSGSAASAPDGDRGAGYPRPDAAPVVLEHEPQRRRA